MPLSPHNGLPFDRHGDRASAFFSLVAPLAIPATDTRTADTAQDDFFPGASGAVAGLVDRLHEDLRPGDVVRATDRSTPTTPATPGTRISTGAIRTTTTRTTSSGRARSAARSGGAFSFGQALAAYLDARRNKRASAVALAFEERLEENLVELHDELAGGTYRPGRSICFVIERPKLREVWAAPFRDRIVHHALYLEVAPRFERAFCVDSCACIAGRGTLYAARRLEAQVRSLTHNWRRPAYYLKCDIANFFISIDKHVLAGQLARRIPAGWWRELAELVLFHDPRRNVEIQGRPELLARIQAHKSLFTQPAHLGLPIGNLSSQFFANVYLDALDQFVKHRLRARHYVRYVDDFILVHEDHRQLNAWRAAIAAFLEERLRVRLNDSKTILQPIERGVDFVGQVLKPWRRTLRRSTFNSALSRLQGLPAAELAQSASSYLGLARQASHGYRDRCRIANLVRRRGLAVDHQLTKVYQ